MMRNIKLIIQYDGTKYCGWQIQKNIKYQKLNIKNKSIQGTIEKALEKILQEKVRVIGSGRTDAGVHALAQVANFKTKSDLTNVQIFRALNSALPSDIRIICLDEVGLNFNSQFKAKSKTYKYVILIDKTSNPFLNRYCYHIPFSLNLPLMRKGAKCLEGRHDFKSFCASGSKVNHPVRLIKKISVETGNGFPALTHSTGSGSILKLTNQGKLVIITIEADGFLYNMVRNIVGTLIDIARGHLEKGDMKRILIGLDRRLAGPTAAAKGLFLCEVKYDE
ncbi:MAG: tRNA pseudouridine(38-40) synthase TruA [Candidatus Omnitrophota bacterium]